MEVRNRAGNSNSQPVEATGHHQVHDAATLERMGHKQELQRNFSMLSMLGLAFAILNTWTALAASIPVAISSGGPSAIIWGLIVAGICNLCLAASLAEFLSAYPTAGGQYHWAALVSPRGLSRGISYVTGWINVAGWVALSATAPLLASQFIIGTVHLMHPEYEDKAWHQFLIYFAITLIALLINRFLTEALPYFTKAAFIWSIIGFVVISITVLACASPNYQSGKFVYTEVVNTTGWPTGVAWMLGLLQGAFALTGFDAVAHMIEEIPRPHIQGPRIMLYCIGIGMVTGFIFLSALLFAVKDIDAVQNAAHGPILEIFYEATNNKAGSVCLIMFPLLCMIFTSTTLVCTSSRMSYAFARDKGMPFSSFFAKIDPKLNLPFNAVLWTVAWMIVFGLILLGSSSAFSAITAASVVALGVTYAIPPAINVCRGRRALPANRSFKIPEPFGWILNIVGIAWSVLTTVLFVFPPELPVNGTNMNYCVVAFLVMVLVAGGTWVFGGNKKYAGPYIEIEGVHSDNVVGLNPVQSRLKAGEEHFENQPVTVV
ncbi:hypothetical protein VHEMI03317 [[Torrubiella] hemipterigena]|uniref:Choline transport protein n=1 Tax=[Torrubiella] hemipterigena TaxID=1531966 RepID=A0A0A1SY58_9HYPO|nr:hypothetical protein VHEMI03317 [[Torrubiella] hemipterigena]